MIASLLGLAVAGYSGLCLLIYLKQDSLTYFPIREIPVDPGELGLDFESFELDLGDSSVTGWIVRADPKAPWILHCHGNGGNIAYRIDYLALFRRLGFNGVVFDYRGYGKSRGQPTESGLTEDALAVREHLVEKEGAKPDKLIYFGESLGGAVACALAEKEPPAGLILKSTFTSYPEMAGVVYPFLPVRLLARARYDSLSKVKDFHFPILVMHSPSDEVIPYHLGQRLFDRASEPKIFKEIGGTHNTSALELGPDFAETVKSFVEQTVPFQ